LELFRKLSETAQEDFLLATDLHAGNVLRAQREPWLVIDPKPFVGDPAYDATQHLLNCPTRLLSQPETTIHRFTDLLQLSQERVRLWTFARLAVQAGDSWQNQKWLQLARAIGSSL
jgi:streptomycin 6-kinase